MTDKDHFLNKKQSKKLDREMQKTIDRIGIDRKTSDEVFDKSTLLTLEKCISNKILDYIDFPISTGKEGNVFLAVTPDHKQVAVKIYRISTATFKHMTHYIQGDPRFQSFHKSRRDIIYAWTSKEYKNLEKLKHIGIRCPEPIAKINNVLIMQYIGNTYEPAPLLKNVRLDNPEEIFKELIKFIKTMYSKANLVHSDLSEFNILMHNQKPYIIDLGQGVLTDHPRANEFLKRDIHTITSHFKKYKINVNEEDIYNNIVAKEEK